MVLARRLLAGGGGGSSFAPPPYVFEMSAAPSGGWTQVQLDRAVYYSGKTYYGYVDGQSGNIEVRAYDHATDTTSSAFVLHAAMGTIEGGNVDSHNAPVLLVRDSDKRMMAFYCGHALNQMYVRVTTNPLPDITSWGAETGLDAQLGKSLYTYPSAFQLLGEASDPIYLFFRDTQGSGGTETSVLCYSTSTDGGSTWAAATELVKRANYLPYWVIDSDGDTRIDVHLMDGTGTALGGSESPVTGRHCYYDGAWRGSDGSALAGSPPYATSALTEVYDASDGDQSHTWDVNTNGGSPVIVMPIDLGSDTRYDYCHWTGSAWECHPITTVDGMGSGGGLCLDWADPTVVYVMDRAPTILQLFRYATSDHGQTWDVVQLTNSATGAWAPVRVRNRAEVRTLWYEGSQPSYLSYDLGTFASRR